MNRQQLTYIVLITILLIARMPGFGFALNELTHEIVNEQALRKSEVPRILREELGMERGLDHPIRDKKVFQWVREGGSQEDQGDILATILLRSRFFRHFHDPLYQADGSGRGSWAQAGLTFLGQHESSIRWMQRPDQDAQAPGTGNWSWQDARRYYLRALTDETKEKREGAFADTFRALGQVMHLVVDASVPEHVRNDEHPLGEIYGNYEYWVSAQHGRPGSPAEGVFIGSYLSNPFPFDPAILQQPTGDDLAPAPIARLIDTDTYTGLASGPNLTLNPAIGIVEFANANFFSEDTGAGQYPFPNINGLIPSQHPAPKTGRVRAYFKKGPSDGIPVDPVLAECILYEPASIEGVVIEPATRMCTDENVWSQTAQAMLPRAVGYARGVLDYFFRGQLEVALVPNAADPSKLDLQATNRSSDALGPGTLTLYVEDANGLRQPVPGASLTLLEPVAPDAGLPVLTFTPPADAKQFIPVFQGPLGQEGGAVVGKVIDIPAVEQIFWDGILVDGQFVFPWFLRTSENVYLLPFEDFLPPSTHLVDRAKWGERDNTLVVQSLLAPNFTEVAFSVFEINRPEGSRQVPTTGALRHGLPVVDLRLVTTLPLASLFGLDLGTTVEVRHTHRFRQYLFSFEHHTFLRWDSKGELYGFDHETISDGQVDVLVNSVETYSRSFPLRLDQEHYRITCGEGACPFYSWVWHDMALTEAGDILLLLSVREGTLPEIERLIPLKGHDPDGNLVTVGEAVITFSFPNDSESPNDREKMRFVAWVNLSRQSVLGKTMADTVVLSQAIIQDSLREEGHFFTHRTGGGPQDGIVDDWVQIFPPRCFPDPLVRETSTLQREVGLLSLTYAGLYRGEFTPLALENDFSIAPSTETVLRCFVFDNATKTAKALKITTISHGLEKHPYRISDMAGSDIAGIFSKNALPGDQGLERFPIVMIRGLGEKSEESQLILWDAVRGSARRLLHTPRRLYSPTANQRWVLVGSLTEAFDPLSYLVAHDGSATFAFPDEDGFFPDRFLEEFTFIAPDHLYNTRDGKFYAIGPTLTKTALPAPLHPVDPSQESWVNAPRWEYHIVRQK